MSSKSATEVPIALSLAWHFPKGFICRGKYALFGWPPLEVTKISGRGLHCIVLDLGFSKDILRRGLFVFS